MTYEHDLTGPGYPRYIRPWGTPRWPGVPVPPPRFPRPGTPAGRRLITPLPAFGGQPQGVHCSAEECENSGLPVRLPGTHLHPLLRRPPVASSAGGGNR